MAMTAGIDWEAAAHYWTEREASEIRMSEDELLALIGEFLSRHKVCALATAGNGIVRNTPVEYLFSDGAFWMYCEGGLKFKALQANPDVCLAVFDDDPSFGGLGGLQVTGKAEVLEPFGSEYLQACELRGLSAERLKKLPFTMHVIKIVPVRYDYLDSSLKGQGYSVRQHWDCG